MMNQPYKWNSQIFWLRVFYMLVVAVLAHLAVVVTWLMLAVQFVTTLVTGQPSHTLQSYCRTTGLYIAEAFAFIGYASEHKPFPFSDWPR